MRRRLILALLGMGLIRMMPVAAYPTPGAGVVAWCDSLPVFAEELDLFMTATRAAAIREVMSQYDLDYSAEFWQAPLPDGQTPYAYWQKKSLQALLPFKVQQQLMMEWGMLDSWAWADFTAAYEAFGLNRQTAWAKGDPVYGPRHLDLSQYYRHYFESRRHDLMRLLQRKGILSAKSLYQDYEALVAQRTKQMQVVWAGSPPNKH
jgi:hypothetical protein